MSKLKYSLTLVAGLAVGSIGSCISGNYFNQRTIDETYQAGKEIGLIEGKEIGYNEGQPEVRISDFNKDGLTDLCIKLSNKKIYCAIDYNGDGVQDLVETELGSDKAKVYIGRGKCPTGILRKKLQSIPE